MPHPQDGPAPDGRDPDGRDPQPAAAAALPFNAPALDGIRRLTALDTVRARIGLAVDLGLLAPGERLPPTDRIAAALGVGEITVRRALSTLCQDGILERRRGRNGGTRVAERPARGWRARWTPTARRTARSTRSSTSGWCWSADSPTWPP
ncbi:GntR family transcriptional regulator, partial [Streptomyces canarius]